MILALYIIFTVCILIPLYTYILFPIALLLLPGKKYKADDIYPYLSVIVAVSNEENTIAEKLKNLQALDYPRDYIEYIFSLYGCTDDTCAVLRSVTTKRCTYVSCLAVHEAPLST